MVRQWVFQQSAEGVPEEGETAALVEVSEADAAALEEDALVEGEVLLQAVHVSVEPYLRFGLGVGEEAPKYAVGDPIRSMMTCVCVASRAPDVLPRGAWCVGEGPWQERFVAPAEDFTRVHHVEGDNVEPVSYLSALGKPGLTAFFSVKDQLRPRRGQVAFVSAAAGAVGQVAGQLLKLWGCERVVGCAGRDDKVAGLSEYGYDAGFNYKTENPADALKRLCPNGVDLFLDLTGGDIARAAWACLNRHGRVSVVGAISSYNETQSDPTAHFQLQPKSFLGRDITMQGFGLFNYTAEAKLNACEIMANMLRKNQLKDNIHMETGIENVFSAFVGIFHGQHAGKVVVRISDPAAVIATISPADAANDDAAANARRYRDAVEAERRRTFALVAGHLVDVDPSFGSALADAAAAASPTSAKSAEVAATAAPVKAQSKLESEDDVGAREVKGAASPSSSVAAAAAAAAAIPPPAPLPGATFVPIESFAWDQGEYNSPTVTVYVDLEGVGRVRNNVTCEFSRHSFDLQVRDLDGRNYRLLKDELDKEILPDESRIVIKRNKVLVKLRKKKGEYSYEQWQNLTAKRPRHGAGGERASAKNKDDPSASLMDMMRDLYEEGDDKMKAVIGEAMYKARTGQPADPVGGAGGMGGGLGGGFGGDDDLP